MSRARDLLEVIKRQGEAALNHFIEARKTEELFLDFKRSSNGGSTERLSDVDRNHYAKAISGFGNSEGGLLVWGIDCSSDPTGADVARAKHPLENPQRFESNLNGLTSGRTVPAHTGVENVSIQTRDVGRGFVVTYIPKSNYAPLQALPSKDFYIRSGSSFDKCPRGVLAGLFGRRPEPIVFPMYTHTPLRWDEGRKRLVTERGLMLTNGGSTPLRHAYCNVAHKMCFRDPNNLGVKWSDTANWRRYESIPNYSTYILHESFMIAPHSWSIPITFSLSIAPPFEGEVDLEVSFGCEGSQVHVGTIAVSAETAQQAYVEHIEQHLELLKKHETIPEQVREQLDKGTEMIFPLPKDLATFETNAEYNRLIQKRLRN